ncbi:MAG TPA: rhodanese-like domain-containing protein [Baekduia sp.]|nr:rhodanese-like domain-containing protein [Baekduia sp.]
MRRGSLLVDVRERAEWDAGHARQALHVPLGGVPARLAELEAEADGRPVVFICRSGARSARAARTAVEGGLREVRHGGGGMAAWTAAGLPLAPAAGRVL